MRSPAPLSRPFIEGQTAGPITEEGIGSRHSAIVPHNALIAVINYPLPPGVQKSHAFRSRPDGSRKTELVAAATIRLEGR